MTRHLSPDATVAQVLLWGGLNSLALILAGLLLLAVGGPGRHGRDVVRVVRSADGGGAADVFRSVPEIVHGLRQHPVDPLAVIALGVVLLLATPVAGVAAAMVVFWAAGDRDYASISALVLALLLTSALLATAA